MKQILLVEDQAIIRYGIVQLLTERFPGSYILIAKNVDEMVIQLTENKPDLLILDINIPGGNGFETLNVIRSRQPDMKILVYSGYDERLYARDYLEAGVQGYLSKQRPAKKLCEAVDIILKGGMYIPAEIGESPGKN